MIFPFYFILVVLIYVLALPLLLFASLKKKYKYSLPARFFLFKNRSFKEDKIWFHACSLGEVNSLKSIIKELDTKDINISVITKTGFDSAKQIEGVDVRFLPYELFLPFWIRRQKVLVVTEAELWPFLFIFSKLNDTKTILLNARISDNSYSSYRKFTFFYRWIFSHIDKVFAQSEIDKKRLEELGASEVEINGNIKTITTPITTKEYKKPKKKIVTLASTHEGEEELLLNKIALQEDQSLVVVPRHPERFGKVNEFISKYAKEKNKTYSKLSEDDSFEADITLCDKMGELVNIYAVSDVTYLCGSFVEGVGGHNPLEPAHFNNKIISGKFFFNQKPLFKLVDNIKVIKNEEISDISYDELEASAVKYKGDIKPLLEEIKE